MSDESKKYLDDILQSIIRIETFIGNKKTFDNYKSNEMLKSSVERQIEIIGEAMNQILKLHPDVQITNARKVVNARNRLIHGYDDIDDGTIWAIIINHLPLLKTEIEKLLHE